MTKRYRLTARAEMNGTVREPGFIFALEDGVLGPHRTVVGSNHGAQIADHMNQDAPSLVDVPLYEEIDEDAERERAEMHVRHAKELADFDKAHADAVTEEVTAERNELVSKQRTESRELAHRIAEKRLKDRHEREVQFLKDSQEREKKAFAKRDDNPGPPPPETNEEALSRRHKAEAESLKLRQEREASALEGGAPSRPEGATESMRAPVIDRSGLPKNDLPNSNAGVRSV